MSVTEEKKKKRKSKELTVEDGVMEESPKKKKKDKKKKAADSDDEGEVSSPKKKRKSEVTQDSGYIPLATKDNSNSVIVNNSGGDWTCVCGHSNFASRRNCQQCRQKNPTADDSGDWVCAKDNCGSSNFASRLSCRMCKSLKDGSFSPGAANQPGDWTCSGCGFSNFSSRFRCKQCNVYNPAAGTNTTGGGGGAEADWECSGCGLSNFASRFKCRTCHTPNAAGGAPGFGGKPGDWACSSCSFSNFASRFSCKQCNEAKPATAGGGGGNTGNNREGEGNNWECKCGFSNFSTRFKCKQCSERNPHNAETEKSRGGAGRGGRGGAGAGGGTGEHADNWRCNCGFSNFPSRRACRSCGERKTAIIVEHSVGMSHMPYESTVDDVTKFFSPLEVKTVNLVMIDGKTQGKANVIFNSHEDAVRAMDKNGEEMGTWNVNLYLDSTDTTAKAGEKLPPPKSNKITFDKSSDDVNGTLNNTGDDTMNETVDSDGPTKKFRWKKMIKTALKDADDKTMSIRDLRKALMPKYTEETGEVCSKDEFKVKLEEVLSKCSKFTYESGNVSM